MVCAIEDEVVVAHDARCVSRRQATAVGVILDEGIESRAESEKNTTRINHHIQLQILNRTINLKHIHLVRVVEYLAV